MFSVDISFNLYYHHVVCVIIIPSHRWGNWGPKSYCGNMEDPGYVSGLSHSGALCYLLCALCFLEPVVIQGTSYWLLFADVVYVWPWEKSKCLLSNKCSKWIINWVNIKYFDHVLSFRRGCTFLKSRHRMAQPIFPISFFFFF